MNTHEFALLFAIAVPVVAIVGLNAFLVAAGERGASLFPSSQPYPADPVFDAPEPAEAAATRVEVAANDEFEREAA